MTTRALMIRRDQWVEPGLSGWSLGGGEHEGVSSRFPLATLVGRIVTVP